MTVAGTYVGTVTSTSNLTIYDFGTFTMPADGKLAIVFVAWSGNSRTVSSVSIDGSTTGVTIHKQNPVNSTFKTAIASKDVLAGSRNVTVTLSSNAGAFPVVACSVWLLTGASATALDAFEANFESNQTPPVSHTMNTPAGGFALFGAVMPNNTPVTYGTATSKSAGTPNGGTYNNAELVTTLQSPHSESFSWSSNQQYGHIGVAFQPSVSPDTSDSLNQASLVVTGNQVSESGSVPGESLNSATLALTSYQVTESANVGDALNQASLIMTSYQVSATIALNDSLNAAGIVVTGYSLSSKMKAVVVHDAPLAVHAPSLNDFSVIEPKLNDF